MNQQQTPQQQQQLMMNMIMSNNNNHNNTLSNNSDNNNMITPPNSTSTPATTITTNNNQGSGSSSSSSGGSTGVFGNNGNINQVLFAHPNASMIMMGSPAQPPPHGMSSPASAAIAFSPMSSPITSPMASPRMGPNGSVWANFVHKLHNMVLDKMYQHLISWNYSGTSFIVCNVLEFSREVLPKHFKHNNFSSFVRQLNMYGFAKVNKSPRGSRTLAENQVWEFSHPKFLRDKPELLDEIKRKALESEIHRRETGELLAQIQVMQLQQAEMMQQMAALHENFRELARKQAIQQEMMKNVMEYMKQTHSQQNALPMNLILDMQDPSLQINHHQQKPPGNSTDTSKSLQPQQQQQQAASLSTSMNMTGLSALPPTQPLMNLPMQSFNLPTDFSAMMGISSNFNPNNSMLMPSAQNLSQLDLELLGMKTEEAQQFF